MLKDLHYIAVEGVIGVGKTSLAQILGRRVNARLVLEKPEENPFLEDFYQDPKRFAFQTQLFFLLSRYRQQMEFPQIDLFHRLIISDYIFAKDKIFAYLNLEDRELLLYEKIWSFMEKDIPKPDLVIYLQSTPQRLLENIRQRDREYEREISPDYIRALCESYNHFFHHYYETPLLIVNATTIDFVHNPNDMEKLIEGIKKARQGINFYNPM